MKMYFITIQSLNVYSVMNMNDKAVRTIGMGYGFTVYEMFVKSATQMWARITSDGIIPIEYVYLSIGSKRFAEAHAGEEAIAINPQWILEIDAFERSRGFTGTTPFL